MPSVVGPTAAVLWHPAGEQSVEQVRGTGTVQACASPGQEAACGAPDKLLINFFQIPS